MSDTDHEAEQLLAEEPTPQPMDLGTRDKAEDSGDKFDNFGVSDAVSLLQSALNNQLASLSKQLISEQKVNAQTLTKKLKEKSGTKFKGEGNRIQYEFNADVLEDLDSLSELVRSVPGAKKAIRAVRDKLTHRNKLIRIADASPAGWKTVHGYECNDYASDSDDDKKIRSAENRALRTAKRGRAYRTVPYNKVIPAAAGSAMGNSSTTASTNFRPQGYNYTYSRRTPQPSDICYKCWQPGHWKNRCPLNQQPAGQPASSSTKQ